MLDNSRFVLSWYKDGTVMRKTLDMLFYIT